MDAAKLTALVRNVGLTPTEVFIGGGIISIQFATRDDALLLVAGLARRGISGFKAQRMDWLEGEPWQVINA